MDLILKSEVKEGLIISNFDEVKGQIEKMVEPYTGLIFSEDQTKEAKSTLANLRKFRKEIDDRRKTVKKEWMAPYDSFEKLAKELLAVVDSPIKEIDSQVKESEQKRIDEKRETIDELKAKIVNSSDYADFIYSLEWFDDPRWLNASTTIKKVENNIIESVQTIEKNLAIISQTTGELAAETTADYQIHGDLQRAILNAKEEARRRDQAAEAQRKIREEQDLKKGKDEAAMAEVSHAVENITETAEDSQEKLVTIKFEISTTVTVLRELKAFFDAHGITPKRL